MILVTHHQDNIAADVITVMSMDDERTLKPVLIRRGILSVIAIGARLLQAEILGK